MVMTDEDLRLDSALSDMPIFPLVEVTLFPRALLPLHIFEPRYRAMLRRALETHKIIAIANVPDPHDTDEHGHPRLSPVAGAGTIVEHRTLADGRSNVVLRGVARVRLSELPFVAPFRRARATLLRDTASGLAEEDRTALLAAATAFAGEVQKRDNAFTFRLPRSTEMAELVDLFAQYLVEDPSARQSILESSDVATRVRLVLTELALQSGRFTQKEDRERTLN